MDFKKFTILLMWIIFSVSLPLFNSGNDRIEVSLKRAASIVQSKPEEAVDLAKTVLEYSLESNDIYSAARSRLLIAEALYYAKKYNDSISYLNNIMLNLNREKNHPENRFTVLKGKALYFTGLNLNRLNNYSSAIKNFKRSLKIIGNSKSPISVKIMLEITRTYLIMSRYKLALEFALKSLSTAKNIKNSSLESESYYLMGYIQRQLKEYDKALKDFKEAEKIAISDKNEYLRIKALNEISNIHFFKKDFDKALNLKKRVLKMAIESGNNRSISFCTNDLAQIYFYRKEFSESLKLFKKSYKLEKRINNARGMAVSEINIAETYIKLRNYKEAEKFAKKSLYLSQNKNLMGEELQSYETLAEIYFQTDRFKEAYRHLDKAYELQKEIFSFEKGRKIAELESKAKLTENENRILLLEKINRITELELEKKRRLITVQKVITLSLIVLITIIFIALRVIRVNNKKLKTANNKLDSLNKNLKIKSLELQNSLDQVQKLSGLLPICASCKKIRDDEGYWHQVEEYIKSHSEVNFSHSLCPVCKEKLYPDNENGNENEELINPS